MKSYIAALVFFVLLVACGGTDTRVDSNVEVPVSVEDIGLKPIEEFVVTTGTVNATQEALMKSESAGFISYR